MRVSAVLPVLLAAPAFGQFTHFETELVSVDRDIAGRITSTVRLYAALLDAGDQLNAVYGSNPNILTLDTTAFNATHPGVSVQILQWDSGRLSNGGERVEIGLPGDVNGVGERQYIRVDRVTL